MVTKPLHGLINKLRDPSMPRLPEYVWNELGPGHNYLREAVADVIEGRVESWMIEQERHATKEKTAQLNQQLDSTLGIHPDDEEELGVQKERSAEEIAEALQAQKIWDAAEKRRIGDDGDDPHTQFRPSSRNEGILVQREVKAIRQQTQRQEEVALRRLVKQSIRQVKQMAKEAEATVKEQVVEAAELDSALTPEPAPTSEQFREKDTTVSGVKDSYSADSHLNNFYDALPTKRGTSLEEDPVKALHAFRFMATSGIAPWHKPRKNTAQNDKSDAELDEAANLARWRDYVRPAHFDRFCSPEQSEIGHETATLQEHKQRLRPRWALGESSHKAMARMSLAEQHEDLTDKLLNEAIRRQRSR